MRFFLEKTLVKGECAVVCAEDGEQALNLLRETAFDLTILDLHPGGRVDGMRVLQAVNWRWPDTAKIILTGQGTLDAAIDAIREGVDAFMLKPVKVDEMLQVVDEVLEKRVQITSASVSMPKTRSNANELERGQFTVDLKNHRIAMSGSLLDLTSYEYSLLVHLIEHDDRPVSPVELVEVVRGYQCAHTQEARDIIKWYIYSLRRKVEPKPSHPRHILNVRGVGYIFKA
ncbi:MAG: response regulator transcription factor [Anaerolineae bacterium]|nr:response regulator transcription factor [Anaerolineae bacterium]